MNQNSLVKEIEENKDRYKIISYEITEYGSNSISIGLKTIRGCGELGMNFINSLQGKFPNLIIGGNIKNLDEDRNL